MKQLFKILGIVLLVLFVMIAAALTYIKVALPSVGDPRELTVD
jgi:hypothetical protein